MPSMWLYTFGNQLWDWGWGASGLWSSTALPRVAPGLLLHPSEDQTGAATLPLPTMGQH